MRRPPLPESDRPPRRARARGPAERRIEEELEAPAPRRAEIQRRQQHLAERVASFLRDQRTNAGARVAVGALLVAAAGGALAYDLATDDVVESVDLAAVQPLQAEVRSGLPTAVGRYPVDPESVTRDARGVYRFFWGPTGAAIQDREATTSVVRMAPGQADELEVPAEGDPILYLRESTPVRVVAQEASPTGSTGGGGSDAYVHVGNWYPYQGSYTRSAVYRSPSVTSLPDDGRMIGSVESPAPRPPAARTIGVPPRLDAVSGQARGTGGGTAATAKSGIAVGKSSVAAPRSGGFSSGVRAASSGGVS